MHHARKERSLILKVSYTETLQTRDTRTADRGRGVIGTGPRCFSLQFRLVASGEAKLADVWHYNECSCEHAFIAGLSTLYKFRTQDDIERAWH